MGKGLWLLSRKAVFSTRTYFSLWIKLHAQYVNTHFVNDPIYVLSVNSVRNWFIKSTPGPDNSARPLASAWTAWGCWRSQTSGRPPRPKLFLRYKRQGLLSYLHWGPHLCRCLFKSMTTRILKNFYKFLQFYSSSKGLVINCLKNDVCLCMHSF
jgi:hypothetical protein